MPSSRSQLRRLQGQVAAAARWNNPDRDAIERDFAAAQLEAFVSRVVSKAPPLTPEQSERIAALLRPTSIARFGGDAA